MVKAKTKEIVVDQEERAFQQQEHIFIAAKNPVKKYINKQGRPRYWKNVGLGFKTPKTAIEGTYVDQKCPYTGNVSIRGRILRGIIISGKMKRTVIVRRNYLHYIRKYQRFEKRHKNFPVHITPAFTYAIGDEVIFGQNRPLSKTVRFNALQVNRKSRKAAKTFSKF